MHGASAVTARYTPTNHSGWHTSLVAERSTVASRPACSSRNAAGTQTASSTATGLQQPGDAARDELGGALALAAQPVDRREVGEAADEEEDRHHLEQPGGEPQARHDRR